MLISDWSSDVCSSDLDDALQTVELAFDEAEIGQDHVDAGIIRIGEGDAAIDHQPLAAAAVAIDVHADFARAAEREKQEFVTWNQNRSEEHTSELQSLMRNSYAVFCLKTKK